MIISELELPYYEEAFSALVACDSQQLSSVTRVISSNLGFLLFLNLAKENPNMLKNILSVL